MSDRRRFPIQVGTGYNTGSISWVDAEKIYAVYADLYGTEQSLERLAERGGFGIEEVFYICQQYVERRLKASFPKPVTSKTT